MKGYHFFEVVARGKETAAIRVTPRNNTFIKPKKRFLWLLGLGASPKRKLAVGALSSLLAP